MSKALAKRFFYILLNIWLAIFFGILVRPFLWSVCGGKLFATSIAETPFVVWIVFGLGLLLLIVLAVVVQLCGPDEQQETLIAKLRSQLMRRMKGSVAFMASFAALVEYLKKPVVTKRDMELCFDQALQKAKLDLGLNSRAYRQVLEAKSSIIDHANGNLENLEKAVAELAYRCKHPIGYLDWFMSKSSDLWDSTSLFIMEHPKLCTVVGLVVVGLVVWRWSIGSMPILDANDIIFPHPPGIEAWARRTALEALSRKDSITALVLDKAYKDPARFWGFLKWRYPGVMKELAEKLGRDYW